MNSAAEQGGGDSNLPDSGEAKLDLRAYWRTIRKRWPFVVLSVIVATVVAFVYTYRQPKIYEATCQVIIEPMAPQVLPGLEGRRRARDRGRSGRTRSSTRPSTGSSSRPASGSGRPRSSGLQYDPDYAGPVGPNHDLSRARARAVAGRSPSSRSRTRALALITVSDRKPQRAALIANTIADTYIEYNLDYKLEGARSAMAWLAEQEADLKRAARAARR